ncbi:MAG TPA: glycosyltransferase family 2 protein [Myxococcales bacterium]
MRIDRSPGGKHVLTATPLEGLETKGAGRYLANGSRGTFELRGEMPEGWIELTLSLRSEGRGRVLVDVGEGFEKPQPVPLPALDGNVRVVARVPGGVRGMRLEITGGAGVELGEASLRKLGAGAAVARLAAPLLRRSFIQPRHLPQAAKKFWAALRAGGPRNVLDQLAHRQARRDAPVFWYPEWSRLYVALTPADRKIIRESIAKMTRRPTFDVILRAPAAADPGLRRSIESVRAQLYPEWRLYIAGEGQAPPELAAQDARLEWISVAAGSSAAAAFERGKGDWVIVLDAGGALAEPALFLFARAVADGAEPDVVYADEDRLDPSGLPADPAFKPDWNPDLFLSQNYIGRACAHRRARLQEIGGFRSEYEGNRDYDLLLRATASGRVRHLPFVVHHQEARSAPDAFDAEAGVRALQSFLGPDTSVAPVPAVHGFRVRWPLPAQPPLVSVIVPTRDHAAVLQTMVESFFARTNYPAYELIVVDNQSEEPAALEYLKSISGRAQVLRYDQPFNFSAINNFAVERARGSVVCLLNNDVEIVDEGWLTEMVSQVLRPEIGAVGARLLYPDGTLQHGGVVVGIGGVAGHAHKHLAVAAPGHCGRAQLVQDVTAVTAACLCVRKQIYQRLSGFDERLAVAFNDVDFCLRVRRGGLRNLWTPYATLLHHESKSRGKDDAPEKRARFRREIEFMRRHWGDVIAYDPAYNPNLTFDAEDFSLAWPPRVAPPWRAPPRDAGWFRDTVRAPR